MSKSSINRDSEKTATLSQQVVTILNTDLDIKRNLGFNLTRR
jgi:hypothetical protein